MARHKTAKRFTTPSATPLRVRIEKALAEGRTQQALELAKSLRHQEPTPENQELLRRASLARARDLAAHGHGRDAAVILGNVLAMDSRLEFQAELACELADCGDPARALQVRAGIEDAALRARILAYVADAALAQGAGGKAVLPPELHGQFDLITQAFAHAEKGEDDAAREKLQGIGLVSPFLEWKVFLRGLLAYYAQDDGRALENWQRLDAQRLPFRLAAPLRCGIDKAFARSQPPAAQAVMQQQALRLQSSSLVAQLRPLQQSIIHERQLPQAFRQAEQALPQLRQQAPQLVPRLAACFYWAIIHHGMPEDMARYRRVFGAPPDDPDMNRLEALALESRGDFATAHRHWQRFEKAVASSGAWPAEQKDRVRALVWARMANNADHMLGDEGDLEEDFFVGRTSRPKPLKPGARECYEQALRLAPDQLATHRALITHLLRQDDAAGTEAAARRLLQHFPDDAMALELLGDLLMRQEKYVEAQEYYRRALHANPLEQRTRHKLANAYTYQARTLAEQGEFDAARAAYQAALGMDDRREKYPILCKWAACEFKAGQADQANELLARADAEKGSRLAVVFSMLIETIRLKLSKLKTQFNNEFNNLLAEPPSGAAAAALADTAAQHRQAGVTYVGQQTHEKKIRTYLEKALDADFTPDQLRQVCAALEVLKIRRLTLQYIRRGQKLFPEDPYFFLAEAEYGLEPDTVYRLRDWDIERSLKQARELAQALPRGDRQDELLRQIQKCEQRLQELNPFANAFANLFGELPFDPFGSDED